MIPFNIGWVFVWCFIWFVLCFAMEMRINKFSKVSMLQEIRWYKFARFLSGLLTGIIASVVHGWF